MPTFTSTCGGSALPSELGMFDFLLEQFDLNLGSKCRQLMAYDCGCYIGQ
jgi:hypothetical protein